MNEPYLVINFCLASTVFLIFVYSVIFSPDKNDYPVPCIHEKITGEPCISCGLSHSFSLVIRGKISEAAGWNVYGLRVFLFFFLQLVIRVVFSFFYITYPDNRRQLIIIDAGGSVILFLITFFPFINSIFTGLIYL